ncbi:MATE family efflux transporter [Ruegeria sp. R13_0]|uniref:MATE family efflux transporter n=1 Tax=Ruegeria sp. R13_0 TaxID=2821099 RepID=UPI001ADC703A|nr:MATE family efflux transporter [Ruegeria sp. R13_0]MBO9437006.1 MATE family efflux transporter [Ruegeria sp. R13_0]
MTQTKHPRPTAISLAREAAPLAAFYGTGILIGLTDLAVVGALGTEALAAVGLGKTILFSLIVVGFAVLSIGTVLMAEQASPTKRGAVLLAVLVMNLPFVVLGLVLPEFTQSVLDQSSYPTDIIMLFSDYTDVLAYAVGPALIFASLKNTLVAIGRTGPLLALSVLMLLVNAACSILLVHGFGTWRGMGVAGAAWATVAVEVLGAVALTFWVARSGAVRIAAARLQRILAALREIALLGWAAGAQQLLESGLFIVVLYLLGLESPAWLAAGTVAFAAMELNFAIGGAVGEVGSARIAGLRVKGDRGGQRRLLHLTILLSGGVSGMFALIVLMFPDAVIGLFASGVTSPEAEDLIPLVMMLTAPFFLFDAWQIVFIFVLRGLRRTLLPLVLSTTCYWGLGIGGGLLLAHFIGLGGWGIWIGFCAGLASAAILLAAMTLVTIKRTSIHKDDSES